ncbi:MAG: hypothetical protein IPP90_15020 [Gemmatimonadaceae bacterium]|nr:hypothetical protein [Gemmatimonadaceae bacterium]
MVGPTLYQVEGQGARIGTTVRVDFASPRLHGPTPTLFFYAHVSGQPAAAGRWR